MALRADEQTLSRAGAPGAHDSFDRLARTMWRLVQKDGCPWDREQTHQSIAKNMIEEAYEAVEAIEASDIAEMREELGDVLMQVMLHANIASKADEFDIDDIIHDLNEKLIRRHPHVFGDVCANSSDEVLNIWQDVKDAERQSADKPKGIMDSVPVSLPSLARAQKISHRAKKVGFSWSDVEDVWDKVNEEKAEFLAEGTGSKEAAEEFGDLLFTLVNVAEFEGIDAEEALRKANNKFIKRFESMEKIAREAKVEIKDLDEDSLDELWVRAKSSI